MFPGFPRMKTSMPISRALDQLKAQRQREYQQFLESFADNVIKVIA
jgi:hypothetical protein